MASGPRPNSRATSGGEGPTLLTAIRSWISVTFQNRVQNMTELGEDRSTPAAVGP